MRLYADYQITLSSEQNKLLIDVHQPGVSFALIQDICKQHPRYHITQFVLLKKALEEGTAQPLQIGVIKPIVDVTISKDKMKASVQVNFSEDMDLEDDEKIACIRHALFKQGVTFGISEIRLKHALISGVQTVVAEGIRPEDGKNASFRYYDRTATTDQITAENADTYQMNLVDLVDEGDWLGEKSPATSGVTGRTVTDKTIPARQGRDCQLRFDPDTVEPHVFDNGRVELRAKRSGAVVIENGKISVSSHLVIDGSVNYHTGNIQFDGSVTIKGSVADRFSVVATGDVEILGPQGIGAVREITSTEGSLYIKGGVNGRGLAVLHAGQDIYAKFVNHCRLVEAQNMIHIGLYAFDSTLKAAKIQLATHDSQLVGGEAIAEHRIVSGVIGNQKERQTRIHITGFNRSEVLAEYQAKNAQIADIVHRARQVQSQLETMERNMGGLDQRERNTYEGLLFRLEQLIDDISHIRKQLSDLEDILRTRGEGELRVMGEIFPRSVLEIKRQRRFIRWRTDESFYVEGNTLHAVH